MAAILLTGTLALGYTAWMGTEEAVAASTASTVGTVLATPETADLGNPFVDVQQSDLCFEPVLWAVEKGVTNGRDATHFAPNEKVKRSEAMAFFWRASGEPAPTTTASPFKDVKKKHWYHIPVLWAVEHEITEGTSPTKFSPNKTCVRSEILKFLYSALGRPAHSGKNPYSDVKKKHWYYDSAIWAYENGLEQGSNGKFKPKTACTRGSVVTYLYRYFIGSGSEPVAPDPMDPVPTEPTPTEPDPSTPHSHSWSAWTQTKAPTCTTAGEEMRACSCGATEIRVSDTVDHDWVHHEEEGWWQSVITCYCGAKFYSYEDWDAHAESGPREEWDNHAGYQCWGEWIVDKAAYDICSRCGATH